MNSYYYRNLNRSRLLSENHQENSNVSSSTFLAHFYNFKHQKFISICSLLLGTCWIWLFIGQFFAEKNILLASYVFECRWFLAPVLFTGIFGFLFKKHKNETIFLAWSLSTLFSLSGCLATVSLCWKNIYSAQGLMTELNTTSHQLVKNLFKLYIQFQSCFLLISLLGIFVSSITVFQIVDFSRKCYCNVVNQAKPATTVHRRRLFFACLFQFTVVVPLRFFVNYKFSQSLSHVDMANFFAYFSQDLFFSIIQALCSIGQLFVLFYLYKYRLLVKTFAALNFLLFIQGIFYIWNAYYVSLYVHSPENSDPSTKSRVIQYFGSFLLSLNFVTYLLATVMSGYIFTLIFNELNLPLVSKKCKFTLSFSVYRFITLAATVILCLALCHLLLNLINTFSIVPTTDFLALNGLSIFYLVLSGIFLNLFLRRRHVLFLVLATGFMFQLVSLSLNTLYNYLAVVLWREYVKISNQSVWQETMMFLESLVALITLATVILTEFLALRILHKRSNSRNFFSTRLERVLQILHLLAWILAGSVILESILIFCAREKSANYLDMAGDQEILDVISVLNLSILQLYTTCRKNTQAVYVLMALILCSMLEFVTTFHYFNVYTGYIQMLIGLFYEHLGADWTMTHGQLLRVLVSYSIQCLQWFTVVLNTVLIGYCLELIVRQDKDAAVEPFVGLEMTNNRSHPNSTAATSLTSIYSEFDQKKLETDRALEDYEGGKRDGIKSITHLVPNEINSNVKPDIRVEEID